MAQSETGEWDKLDNGSALITGVIVARRDVVEANPGAVDSFLQNYAASVEWVNGNTAEAAALVGEYGIVDAAVAEKADLSKKDAEAAITAAVEAITGALIEGEKVQLVGFGSFEVKTRAARVGRNPKTGEEIPISEARLPVFKAGKALKDAAAK